MSSGNHRTELGATISTIQEAPSTERAFYIERDEHVSRTGRAQSHWTYYHAPHRTLPGRLLIIGGLGGVESAYTPVAKHIAHGGLDTITMNLPTYQHSHHQYHRDHLLHPERLLAQMVRRITRDIKAEYGDEPVDAAGHSTGAPAITQAADFDPQLLHSVTLWQPPGLTKGGIVRLATRIPKVLSSGLKSRGELGENLSSLTHELLGEYAGYVQNIPRRVLEAAAVSNSDIRAPLTRVKSSGVKAAAILAINDAFFPVEEATLSLLEAGIVPIRLEGCHLIPLAFPARLAAAQLMVHEALYAA